MKYLNKTKKEMRQFLGLADYHHRFVSNYSDVTSLLMDGSARSGPVDEAVQVFIQVKA